ncbi:hypothetical protein ACFL14_00875 [Patescibacteria group bacterium]
MLLNIWLFGWVLMGISAIFYFGYQKLTPAFWFMIVGIVITGISGYITVIVGEGFTEKQTVSSGIVVIIIITLSALLTYLLPRFTKKTSG